MFSLPDDEVSQSVNDSQLNSEGRSVDHTLGLASLEDAYATAILSVVNAHHSRAVDEIDSHYWPTRNLTNLTYRWTIQHHLVLASTARCQHSGLVPLDFLMALQIVN